MRGQSTHEDASADAELVERAVVPQGRGVNRDGELDSTFGPEDSDLVDDVGVQDQIGRAHV